MFSITEYFSLTLKGLISQWKKETTSEIEKQIEEIIKNSFVIGFSIAANTKVSNDNVNPFVLEVLTKYNIIGERNE